MRELSPPSASTAYVAPVTCPSCQSSSILTTAKKHDADSYWRCRNCGEVWNAARMHHNRYRWQ
ncbi:MAG TPA: hypothetical protein VM818_08400 [Vicinamibacterales bacterium]|nr:hypothetical protein [Vicinamibacterales bacterium]